MDHCTASLGCMFLDYISPGSLDLNPLAFVVFAKKREREREREREVDVKKRERERGGGGRREREGGGGGGRGLGSHWGECKRVNVGPRTTVFALHPYAGHSA